MANNNVNFKKFLNMLAFVGIVAVAVALLCKPIFSAEIGNVFSFIAQCIAYLVTAVYALYYVLSKRNSVITIIFVISVIAIIVLLIVYGIN